MTPVFEVIEYTRRRTKRFSSKADYEKYVTARNKRAKSTVYAEVWQLYGCAGEQIQLIEIGSTRNSPVLLVTL